MQFLFTVIAFNISDLKDLFALFAKSCVKTDFDFDLNVTAVTERLLQVFCFKYVFEPPGWSLKSIIVAAMPFKCTHEQHLQALGELFIK